MTDPAEDRAMWMAQAETMGVSPDVAADRWDARTPVTPAVPEPVAYTDEVELEAVKSGNGLMWPSPLPNPDGETGLYTAAQMQALADRLAECEKERDWLRENSVLMVLFDIAADRATTAEAALESARKVIEPFADCTSEWDGEMDALHVFLEWNDEGDPAQSLPVADFRAARQWLSATRTSPKRT